MQAVVLLELGANPSLASQVPSLGATVTPLALAIVRNDVDVVEKLLVRGAALDAVDDNGRTALYYAVRVSNVRAAYGITALPLPTVCRRGKAR